MSWLSDSAELALVVGVRLGIPVIVLFVIGYRAFRAERRHQRLLFTTHRVFDGDVWRGLTGPGAGRRCWETKQCPPEVRDFCPAFNRPDLPCWKAIKAINGGRIKSECVSCMHFLSGPQVILPQRP